MRCHATLRLASVKTLQLKPLPGHAGRRSPSPIWAGNVERYTRKALSGAALVAELEWQRASIPARLREYVFGGAS